MTEPTDYVPPKVWSWNKETGGRFASDQPSGRRAHA